ncbi:MAG: hemolysin family protein [Anaerolineae bacterium]
MSLGEILLRLSAVAALLFINGFFVAVEFGLVGTRRTRIDELAEKGDKVAGLLQVMLRDPDRVLAASQLGITMASLGLGWIGEATIADLIMPLVEQLPFGPVIAHTVGIVVSFFIITSLHIIVGEQAPKIVAIRNPERISLATVRPVWLFDKVFRPFIWFLDAGTSAFLRLIGVQPMGHHGTVYTLDELARLLVESREAGIVEPVEEQIISRAFEFSDRQVREVMIPRTAVDALPADSTIGDLLTAFQDTPHARFPVYDENLDNIVGVVTIKDVLLFLADHRDGYDAPLRGLLREGFYVPETKPINDLMAEMRQRRAQIAIVIDEHGGTAGIVTAEELTEEIVGPMGDELVEEEPTVQTIDEQTVQVGGEMRVDELNEALGLSLPEHEDYETVAGLILHRLQRIPMTGDEAEVGDVQLTVAGMRGPKIEAVFIHRGRKATVTG